jgi:selenocysteine lyase/cysteine desulfurase
MRAAVEYLAELGGHSNGDDTSKSRRLRIVRAMETIREYETTLSAALLEGLRSIKGATVYGKEDPRTPRARVPTVCFNLKNIAPAEITARLAEKGIAVRDGHMYSPRLMKRLGLSADSGAVRVSLVHYNNHQEIQLFLKELREIAGK